MVVTDTVFSMDGDAAPSTSWSSSARRHDALLVLDEAHAVLGPRRPSPTRVVVGTLSKTLGALGGFVAGRRPSSTCS
jgi:8-amino-7-oxononanoate synthase